MRLLDRTEVLERQLLLCLTTTDTRRMLGDLSITKDLISLKESYDGVMERSNFSPKLNWAIFHRLISFSLTQSLADEKVTVRQVEMLADIGNRGAILFNTIRCFGFIDPLYSASWGHFQRIFDSAISGSNRQVLLMRCTLYLRNQKMLDFRTRPS